MAEKLGEEHDPADQSDPSKGPAGKRRGTWKAPADLRTGTAAQKTGFGSNRGGDDERAEWRSVGSSATKEAPGRLSRGEKRAVDLITDARQRMLEAEWMLLQAEKMSSEMTDRADFLQDSSDPTKDGPARETANRSVETRLAAEQLALEAEWLMSEADKMMASPQSERGGRRAR